MKNELYRISDSESLVKDGAYITLNEIGRSIDDYRKAPLAEGVCERIIGEIIEFESNLPENMQAGGRLVNFAGEVFSINDVTYSNPNLIIFYGNMPNGNPVKLVQHQAQLNLLLVAVPVAEPSQPRRKIGFSKVDDAK